MRAHRITWSPSRSVSGWRPIVHGTALDAARGDSTLTARLRSRVPAHGLGRRTAGGGGALGCSLARRRAVLARAYGLARGLARALARVQAVAQQLGQVD